MILHLYINVFKPKLNIPIGVLISATEAKLHPSLEKLRECNSICITFFTKKKNSYYVQKKYKNNS